MRQVLLIIGPPGSGKSTHAQQSGLTHHEREHYGSDKAFKAAAANAARQPNAQLAIVRCCPTHAEQREWEPHTNPTTTTALDIPAAECARRIHQRHRKNWRGEIQAAKRWHQLRNELEPVASRTW